MIASIGRGGGQFTQLQVIKLAFICYGHVLAQHGRRLFNEDIEAWAYGPVIPSLYDTLKIYGSLAIPELQYCRTKINGSDFTKRMDFISEKIDKDTKEILNVVIDEYGKLTGPALLRLTHLEGTPWSKSYVKGQYHTIIPDEIIREYYSNIDVK